MEVGQFTPVVPEKCAACAFAGACADKLGVGHASLLQMAETHFQTDEQLQIRARDNPGAYASAARTTRDANAAVQLHIISALFTKEMALRYAWWGCYGPDEAGNCSLPPEVKSQLT